MKKLFLVAALVLPAISFADVMNLNEFVPTNLEDASPVDEHHTIFQLSGKFKDALPDELTYRPDIRYGLTDRLQLEATADMFSGGKESRSGETRASVLYELNEPENAFPVIAVNPWVAFPTGKSTDGYDPGVKIILSSTLTGTTKSPETQVHANYQLRHNSERGTGERADGALYAAGISRRIKEKLAFVADVIYQDSEEKDESENYLEAGLHHEFSKGYYLGYGWGKGIGPSSADWSGIVSLELEI